MKIFITGIAGFIGSHLADFLTKNGHQVYGIDNLFSGFRTNVPPGIPWKVGDIRDIPTLKELEQDYDAVLHLAAQTSGEKSFEIPLYDLETNLKGSYNVYEFAKKCRAKLMVNMSSMSVYGEVPSGEVAVEDRPLLPVSLYGNTKLAAERMLMQLSGIEGLPVLSLRLFNAYGPGQDLNEMKQGMVSIYLSYFLNHPQVIVKGSFDRVRDFIYIEDIAQAIVQTLKPEGAKSGVYNLSTGTATSIRTLISLLKAATSSPKEVVSMGNTHGDVFGFAGCSNKFQKEFMWTPKYSLEQGLLKMVSHYKEYQQ